MKNIFSFNKQTRPKSEIPIPEPPPPPRANTAVHTTGLQPKYTVPPVPHPRPYDHIAILATASAILLRPRIAGVEHPQSHVHVAYGKDVKVEEHQGDGEGPGADWSAAVVVYGIVGILELFTSASNSTLACVWMIGKPASILFARDHFQDGRRLWYVLPCLRLDWPSHA
jgi:hypothetical protein